MVGTPPRPHSAMEEPSAHGTMPLGQTAQAPATQYGLAAGHSGSAQQASCAMHGPPEVQAFWPLGQGQLPPIGGWPVVLQTHFLPAASTWPFGQVLAASAV